MATRSRHANHQSLVGRIALLAAFLVLGLQGAARAEKAALLIGNAEYRHSARLGSPLNDVDAMKTRLEALGFAVETLVNADRLAMGAALIAFGETARNAETALVYYSGHGMEIAGENYLIPTDATLEREDHAGLQAIHLDDVARAASGAARLSVVILDACRNNTFPSSAKSGAKGFRPVSARPGQVVVFSTAPGTVAYDGGGGLSPFTRALTGALETRAGQDVRILMTSLGVETERFAGAPQRPFARFGDMPQELVTLGGPTVEATPVSASEPAPTPAPRETGVDSALFRDCDACPEMATLPGGAFLMGSPASEAGRHGDEGPQRRVSVAPFALAVAETSFESWDSCVADGYCRPVEDKGWGRGRRPVIQVSWQDVTGEGVAERGYLAWLNSKAAGAPYRLPSEAEWEYAARAGSTDAFPWGAAVRRDRANYGAEACCSGKAEGGDRWVRTAPVGSFPPNAFGLHDLQGNVLEWVQDCWHRSYRDAPVDGSAWMAAQGGDCGKAMLRGGSWYTVPANLRSANRSRKERDFSSASIGFRVARSAPR